jgi:hypothetical protein
MGPWRLNGGLIYFVEILHCTLCAMSTLYWVCIIVCIMHMSNYAYTAKCNIFVPCMVMYRYLFWVLLFSTHHRFYYAQYVMKKKMKNIITAYRSSSCWFLVLLCTVATDWLVKCQESIKVLSNKKNALNISSMNWVIFNKKLMFSS